MGERDPILTPPPTKKTRRVPGDLPDGFTPVLALATISPAEKKAVETVGIRISLELYYFLACALALQCREIRTQRGSLSVR